MQYFDRDHEKGIPEVLSRSHARLNRKIISTYFRLEPAKRAQTDVPDLFPLDDNSLLEGLHKLFRDKCAFCESSNSLISLRPYKFRPVSDAEPSAWSAQSHHRPRKIHSDTPAHLYYFWLADAWENQYPICVACRPLRVAYFPVEGQRAPIPHLRQIAAYVERDDGLWGDHPPREKNLFLDPCATKDFYRHFEVTSDGDLFALTKRGQVTVQAFNLRREDLKARRAERYREYFSTLTNSLRQGAPLRSSSDLLSSFDFHQPEFSGTWYILLRQLALKMGANVRAVSSQRIHYFFGSLSGQEDRIKELEGLFQEPTEEPPAVRAPQADILLPRLHRVKVSHFKAIENVSFTLSAPVSPNSGKPSTPSLLIIGENASGKSSLLEAIALGLAEAKMRSALNHEINDLIFDPDHVGGERSRLPSARIVLEFEGGTRKSTAISDKYDDVWNALPLAPPVFAYGAFRQYLKEDRPVTNGHYIRNLFESNFILPNPEKWLMKLSLDNFNIVVRALRHILSIEGEFDVIERDRTTGKCFIITEVIGAGDQRSRMKTPLRAASSGYRSILAMMCDIFRGLMDKTVNPRFESLKMARAVVLVDEIEAHLHPRWKIQIMSGLRQALPQVTFIATTHDPLCLRGLEKTEVMLMQRIVLPDTGGASFPSHSIEGVMPIIDSSRLSIGQLLTSDLFQLLSTDDPLMERDLSKVEIYLKQDEGGHDLDDDSMKVVEAFKSDIADALPVGTSEIHRLVQQALAKFLKDRRNASIEQLKSLKDSARREIRDALKSMRIL